jgi:hypothetical protein
MGGEVVPERDGLKVLEGLQPGHRIAKDQALGGYQAIWREEGAVLFRRLRSPQGRPGDRVLTVLA